MVQGSWTEDPLYVSFFLFFLLFFLLFFIPYDRINCRGWGQRFLLFLLRYFFLHFSHSFAFSLGLLRANTAGAGLGYWSPHNVKYNFYLDLICPPSPGPWWGKRIDSQYDSYGSQEAIEWSRVAGLELRCFSFFPPVLNPL